MERCVMPGKSPYSSQEEYCLFRVFYRICVEDFQSFGNMKLLYEE